MDAKEFQNVLHDLLTELLGADFDDEMDLSYLGGGELEELNGICTFEDAGVLTIDAGVVVEFTDGSEFRISIVQSKGKDR